MPPLDVGTPGRLASPGSVRERLGMTALDLPDEALAAFIREANVFVARFAGRAFDPGEPNFVLAAAAATDFAAAAALRLLTARLAGQPEYRLGKLGVRRQFQLDAWRSLAADLEDHGAELLEVLRREGRCRFVLVNGRN